MYFEYHHASIRQLVCTNVLVYMHVHVFLRVSDIDVKITKCMYTYTVTHVCLCDNKEVYTPYTHKIKIKIFSSLLLFWCNLLTYVVRHLDNRKIRLL